MISSESGGSVSYGYSDEGVGEGVHRQHHHHHHNLRTPASTPQKSVEVDPSMVSFVMLRTDVSAVVTSFDVASKWCIGGNGVQVQLSVSADSFQLSQKQPKRKMSINLRDIGGVGLDERRHVLAVIFAKSDEPGASFYECRVMCEDLPFLDVVQRCVQAKMRCDSNEDKTPRKAYITRNGPQQNVATAPLHPLFSSPSPILRRPVSPPTPLPQDVLSSALLKKLKQEVRAEMREFGKHPQQPSAHSSHHSHWRLSSNSNGSKSCRHRDVKEAEVAQPEVEEYEEGEPAPLLPMAMLPLNTAEQISDHSRISFHVQDCTEPTSPSNVPIHEAPPKVSISNSLQNPRLNQKCSFSISDWGAGDVSAVTESEQGRSSPTHSNTVTQSSNRDMSMVLSDTAYPLRAVRGIQGGGGGGGGGGGKKLREIRSSESSQSPLPLAPEVQPASTDSAGTPRVDESFCMEDSDSAGTLLGSPTRNGLKSQLTSLNLQKLDGSEEEEVLVTPSDTWFQNITSQMPKPKHELESLRVLIIATDYPKKVGSPSLSRAPVFAVSKSCVDRGVELSDLLSRMEYDTEQCVVSDTTESLPTRDTVEGALQWLSSMAMPFSSSFVAFIGCSSDEQIPSMERIAPNSPVLDGTMSSSVFPSASSTKRERRSCCANVHGGFLPCDHGEEGRIPSVTFENSFIPQEQPLSGSSVTWYETPPSTHKVFILADQQCSHGLCKFPFRVTLAGGEKTKDGMELSGSFLRNMLEDDDALLDTYMEANAPTILQLSVIYKGKSSPESGVLTYAFMRAIGKGCGSEGSDSTLGGLLAAIVQHLPEPTAVCSYEPIISSNFPVGQDTVFSLGYKRK